MLPYVVKSIYIKTWCMLPYVGKVNIYQDVVYVTLGKVNMYQDVVYVTLCR